MYKWSVLSGLSDAINLVANVIISAEIVLDWSGNMGKGIDCQGEGFHTDAHDWLEAFASISYAYWMCQRQEKDICIPSCFKGGIFLFFISGLSFLVLHCPTPFF